jgi:Ni2+-binding GTPase involved in maturation of urease and hydrogenase
MTAAPFVWRADGRPDWRAMWESFCDLALHGGPPHRGPDRALRAVAEGDDAASTPEMIAEIRRGIWETTGLFAEAAAPGWIAVTCTSPAMAAWLAAAIALENVEARAGGDRVLLVAGPRFRLDDEVKSAITVVAKTHHFWDAHGGGADDAGLAAPQRQFRCVRCGIDFLVSRPDDTAAAAATCPLDGSRLAHWDGPPTLRRRVRAYEHAHGPGQPVHAHGAADGAAAVASRSPRGVPRPLRVGVGGPAGSGKSTLIEAIGRRLAGRLAIVGPGAVAAPDAIPDLVLYERRSPSAAEAFGPEAVDATVGVLALATASAGGAAGAAVTRWRLLVVSRAADAAALGVDLAGLEGRLRAQRGGAPVVVTDLTAPGGVDAVVAWLEHELLLGA